MDLNHSFVNVHAKIDWANLEQYVLDIRMLQWMNQQRNSNRHKSNFEGQWPRRASLSFQPLSTNTIDLYNTFFHLWEKNDIWLKSIDLIYFKKSMWEKPFFKKVIYRKISRTNNIARTHLLSHILTIYRSRFFYF